MSQNTKKESYKKYLQLIERRHEIHEAQSNLGYVELEKPIHHGYTCNFVLRDDVQKRVDGPILAKLLTKYSTVEWSRTKDFIKGKKRNYVKIEPKFLNICENEYEKLDIKTREFFRITWVKGWNEYYKAYVLDFPSYYVVIKKRKDYITHRKEIDGVLESEERLINDMINQISYISSPYDDGSMKPYAKIKNKSERRKNKIILKRNIDKTYVFDVNPDGDLDKGLSYQHRNSAKWERW